jgi:hypothetical protein
VLKDPGMGRTSIAIAPSNQSVVYAASASVSNGRYLNGLHAAFRSTSSGEAGSWTAQTRNDAANKLNTVLFSNPLGAFLGECGLAPGVFSNQGWYDNVIAVDPGDVNRVWVGGIDLFRSDDGGVNWGLASYWWTEKSDPRYAHADHHVITFHPQYNGANNKQMFVGMDGGVFRTDDARAPVATASKAACNPDASGVAWTSLNNGYGVTQFYHGAVFPDGKSYFGGTQDNGILLGVDGDGVNAWKEVFGGDGGYVALPIDLGPDLGSASDQVFLILFGTGFRNRSALSTVVARIGGENSEVSYAGAQGGFVGLDQANLRLPRSLAGRGEVDIVMSVDGKTANTVRVNVK